MGYKVSIIILADSKPGFIENCLPALKLHTDYDDYEVIVVDNGCSDATNQYLKGLTWIKLIEGGPDISLAGAKNAAVRRSAGDIVFLDNDIIVSDSDWLTKLNQSAYSQYNIGIVGCLLVDEAGDLFHAGTYVLAPDYRKVLIGNGEKDINQYNALREVDSVLGSCMYIKRTLLEKLGPLDESFFSYFEDTDYCLKARTSGFKVVCDGAVKLTHFTGADSAYDEIANTATFQKSRQDFADKWRDYFNDYYETEVMWQSIIEMNIGYAVTSRSLLLALDNEKVDVRYGSVYGVDERPSRNPKLNNIRRRPKSMQMPQVIYGQGDVFYKNSGKYKIGYTMLEVSGIPGHWVDLANMMDEVWVPSHFNQETFKASGVKRPIKVMPLGIDPDYFNPRIKSFHQAHKYVFLSVFEWSERKAPEVLIKAFNEEFSGDDDVLLILKILNFDTEVSVVEEIAKLKPVKQNGPKIVIMLNKHILDYQMGALYRSADCFVLPTRGEGWGMPILEAMACGLPVICTDWGAQTEFINSDICYPIQVKRLIPAKAKCPYYAGFEWADPDSEHLRQLMRYVYEHRAEAREKGGLAAQTAISKWTWSKAAKRIKKRLIEVSE